MNMPIQSMPVQRMIATYSVDQNDTGVANLSGTSPSNGVGPSSPFSPAFWDLLQKRGVPHISPTVPIPIGRMVL